MNNSYDVNTIIKTKTWVIIIILLLIPIINCITFVVLLSGNFNPSIKNYAKAVFGLFLFLIALFILTMFFDLLIYDILSMFIN